MRRSLGPPLCELHAHTRWSDGEPVLAAHAVAVGLREFVSVDDGIAEAMRSAAEAGAAIVAAHPNADEPALQSAA